MADSILPQISTGAPEWCINYGSPLQVPCSYSMNFNSGGFTASGTWPFGGLISESYSEFLEIFKLRYKNIKVTIPSRPSFTAQDSSGNNVSFSALVALYFKNSSGAELGICRVAATAAYGFGPNVSFPYTFILGRDDYADYSSFEFHMSGTANSINTSWSYQFSCSLLFEYYPD